MGRIAKLLQVAHGAAAATATLGLAGVSALHLVWASGSHWPARSERALADAVAGSRRMPPPAASAVVGVGAAVAAAWVPAARGRLGALGTGLIGAGLLARGVAGGVVAARALGMPETSRRFRRLDERWYRPLCLVLGTAAMSTAAMSAALTNTAAIGAANTRDPA